MFHFRLLTTFAAAAWVLGSSVCAQTSSDARPKLGWNFTRQTWVPLRDGVRLATSIFVPAKAGRYPVVLQRTPYDRAGLLGGGFNWAQAGYVFIAQDVRGRYDSEGAFDPIVQEVNDTPDVIAWIRKQPWCDGRVGMMGPSYLSLVQSHGLKGDGVQPPDALMPTFAGGDGWERGFYTRGPLGLFQTYTWLNYDVGGRVGQANLMQFVNLTQRMRHLPLMTMDDVDGSGPNRVWRERLSQPSQGEFWRQFSIRGYEDRFTMPTLQVGGWYDYYPAEMLGQWQRMIARAKSPQVAARHRIVIGPWGHNHGLEPTPDGQRAIDFGPESKFDANQLYREFFDEIFYDKQPQHDAPVRLFVMGRNVWRNEQEWPLRRAQVAEFYLHSDGKANTVDGDGRLDRRPPAEDEPTDRYVYDPNDPVPTRGGNHSVGPWNSAYRALIWCGPCDQTPNERRADVLVYTGDVLTDDLEATGPVSLTFCAASSAKDTDFVARLVDVHPDGRAINITEGVVRARYRGPDGSRPELLEPNRPTDFTIDLQATSNVFRKGHRIRLDLTSSNFPLWDRNLNTGDDPNRSTTIQRAEQTIFHTKERPAVLRLPIVPNES